MRPILFTIGRYDVFAGPVFAGLSAILAFFYIRHYRSHANLSWAEMWTLMLFLTVGNFMGSVLLYLSLFGGGLAKNLEYVVRYRAIQGGTFYGNFWGCFAAMALFAFWHRKKLPALADLLGVSSMLGLFLMRWGCLQHGCCFGTYTKVAWALRFPYPYYGIRNTLVGLPIHPTQIYSGVGALLIFLAVHFWVFRRVLKKELPAGAAFVASTLLYGIFRFFLEFVRGSDRGIFQPFGMTTSQVLALASIAGALYFWKTLQSPSARPR